MASSPFPEHDQVHELQDQVDQLQEMCLSADDPQEHDELTSQLVEARRALSDAVEKSSEIQGF